jgi:P22 tail accessory factor
MATARDIVERAYRKIGVVATDEAMTADQASVGVDDLNMMMHGLVLDGIDTGWADLQSADEFTMEPEFHEGLVYMLASRLAPDFAVPGFSDTTFKRRLAAAYLIIPDAVIDPMLRRRSFMRYR